MNDKYEKLESLFELASLLSEQTDFSEILRVISSKIASIFNAEVASIVLINPRTQETLKTVIKVKKKIDEVKCQFLQTNIIGWSMKNKQSFLSSDLHDDSRLSSDRFKDITVKSAMCVPLKYRGSNFGYIVVLNDNMDSVYDNESLKLLERISDISAPHISNVQKIQEYFTIPLHDDSILYKYLQLGLLGKSEAFIAMLQSVEAAARCDVRVVLEGQTGTGKELIARAIHKLSMRSQHLFVPIDCGAIPVNLMESELFGHVKGAFTGANRDRKGLIAEANKGTLFMDEINNLSMEMQSKLLRVLQDGEVRPVGSNRNVKVDVRIVSASSLSLSGQVEVKKFREDLYFRLMVYPIYVPTLDERKKDIPILANSFLTKYSNEQNKKIAFFHRDINEYLKFRHWAGNVRELENFVERLVTYAPESAEVLDITVLPQDLRKTFEDFAVTQRNIKEVPLKESLQEYEKNMILKALGDNDWNQTKAARMLNVLEATLRAKMKKLGISRTK